MTPSRADRRTLTDAVAIVAAQAGADVVRRGYGTQHQWIAESSTDFAGWQQAGERPTSLTGGPLHSGRGLIAAADKATHADMVELIRPHLEAAQNAQES